MESNSNERLQPNLLPSQAQNKGTNQIPLACGRYLIYFFTICFVIYSCKEKPKNLIEATLLDQNWQKVFDACKQDDSLLKKPETIGILGHASIMLNKNNASYVLLTSITADSVKRKGWQKWANDFVLRFPNQAIAYYFQGDAYMRNGNKEGSMGCFNKAINIDPGFTLALNARGILHATDNNRNLLDIAISDFDKACNIDSTKAAFFLNRGTAYYNHKLSSNADKDFTKALLIDSSYAIALNSKACVRAYEYWPSLNVTGGQDTIRLALVDTISGFFLNAYSKLSLSVIQENLQIISREFDNRIAPQDSESPDFSISDFSDWDSLRNRSFDKSDFLHLFIGAPLPSLISDELLTKLNSGIKNPNLFDIFLQNRNVPDSLKSIINSIKKTPVSATDPNFDKVAIVNRLTLERLYGGSIVSFRKRGPGMFVDASSQQVNFSKLNFSAHKGWRTFGRWVTGIGNILVWDPRTVNIGQGFLGVGLGAKAIGKALKKKAKKEKEKEKEKGKGKDKGKDERKEKVKDKEADNESSRKVTIIDPGEDGVYTIDVKNAKSDDDNKNGHPERSRTGTLLITNVPVNPDKELNPEEKRPGGGEAASKTVKFHKSDKKIYTLICLYNLGYDTL